MPEGGGGVGGSTRVLHYHTAHTMGEKKNAAQKNAAQYYRYCPQYSPIVSGRISFGCPLPHRAEGHVGFDLERQVARLGAQERLDSQLRNIIPVE